MAYSTDGLFRMVEREKSACSERSSNKTRISDNSEYWDPEDAERSPLELLGPRLPSDTLTLCSLK
jgi:hypothetical protein